MKELVVNIWVYIDLVTELAYNWSGRVYCIDGTDQEKLTILKKLASYDFLVCKRNPFPESITAIMGDKELKGYIPFGSVKSFFEMYPDLFYNELDKQLPLLMNLNSRKVSYSKQNIPDNSLYVITQIFEDEEGKQHPILTAKDVQWLQKQRQYRGNIFKF